MGKEKHYNSLDNKMLKFLKENIKKNFFSYENIIKNQGYEWEELIGEKQKLYNSIVEFFNYILKEKINFQVLINLFENDKIFLILLIIFFETSLLNFIEITYGAEKKKEIIKLLIKIIQNSKDIKNIYPKYYYNNTIGSILINSIIKKDILPSFTIYHLNDNIFQQNDFYTNILNLHELKEIINVNKCLAQEKIINKENLIHFEGYISKILENLTIHLTNQFKEQILYTGSIENSLKILKIIYKQFEQEFAYNEIDLKSSIYKSYLYLTFNLIRILFLVNEDKLSKYNQEFQINIILPDFKNYEPLPNNTNKKYIDDLIEKIISSKNDIHYFEILEEQQNQLLKSLYDPDTNPQHLYEIQQLNQLREKSINLNKNYYLPLIFEYIKTLKQQKNIDKIYILDMIKKSFIEFIIINTFGIDMLYSLENIKDINHIISLIEEYEEIDIENYLPSEKNNLLNQKDQFNWLLKILENDSFEEIEYFKNDIYTNSLFALHIGKYANENIEKIIKDTGLQNIYPILKQTAQKFIEETWKENNLSPTEILFKFLDYGQKLLKLT